MIDDEAVRVVMQRENIEKFVLLVGQAQRKGFSDEDIGLVGMMFLASLILKINVRDDGNRLVVARYVRDNAGELSGLALQVMDRAEELKIVTLV